MQVPCITRYQSNAPATNAPLPAGPSNASMRTNRTRYLQANGWPLPKENADIWVDGCPRPLNMCHFRLTGCGASRSAPPLPRQTGLWHDGALHRAGRADFALPANRTLTQGAYLAAGRRRHAVRRSVGRLGRRCARSSRHQGDRTDSVPAMVRGQQKDVAGRDGRATARVQLGDVG